MSGRMILTKLEYPRFLENRVQNMPGDMLKTVGAGIAGKVRDEIGEELVGLAADVAKRELAHRHGGHIEEPYAAPGCGVFDPPCTWRTQPYCHGGSDPPANTRRFTAIYRPRL